MHVDVYVRDDTLQRVAQLERFDTLTTVERYLGVGSWVVTTPFEGEAVDALLTRPGSGIEVRAADGTVLFAGPLDKVTRERGAADRVTFSGHDDNVWLADRLALPEPLTADPASWVTGYNVHTGPVSTAVLALVDVQLGPGAVVDRRVPRLVLGNDPVDGPTVTIRARLTPVLEVIEPLLRANNMVARIRQVGEELVFDCRDTVERASVVFSPEWSTLAGWRYAMEGPKATAVYVAGQGDLAARTIRLVANTPPVEWGRRVERLYDQRNSETAAELVDAGTQYLVENAAVTSLDAEPAGDEFVYRRDYDLGDRVKLVVDGTSWFEPVTTMTTVYDASGVRQKVTVGPEQATGPAALFGALRRHGSQIRNLEAT